MYQAQTQKQQFKNRPVDMVIQFPDELGQELKEQANANAFVVHATKKAMLEQWQDEEVRKGIAEADAGEFASDEEVEAFFTKWTPNENS